MAPIALPRRPGAAVFCALGLLFGLSYFVAPVGADGRHVMYQVAGLIGLSGMALGIRRNRPSGVLWPLMFAGLALWISGDGYWNAVRWITGREAGFPSFADALYLLAYLPLLVGIGLLIRGGRPTAADVVDGLIVGLAAGLVVWFAALAPATSSGQPSAMATVVADTYPTMDYLLVLGLVQLTIARSWRNGALRWVLAAFTTVLVTDLVYAWQRAHDTFTAMSPVNFGYFAFYVFLGAATLSPSMARLGTVAEERPTGRLTLRRMALLGAALLASPAALVLSGGRDGKDAVALALAGGAISLLVLIRMALLFVERDRADAERRQAQERLREMAYRDALTGLANRTSLYRHLSEALRELGDGLAVAVIFVDLDGFKDVNDRHGHAVGDEVLQVVAERLRATVRSGDLVARHGGDEFVIVLGSLPPGHARAVAAATVERLLQATRLELELEGGVAISTSASAGVAFAPADATTGDALIRRADAAMYDAKRRRPAA